MKLSFRWYGEDDPVKLGYIRQIPNMHSIVAAVYDVPAGEVWPRESIARLKSEVEENGMVFDVVESVPVHEDIKLGKPSRDRFIGNYIENIRRLGEAGVRCVCYNFMPVFDWTRSELDRRLPDGSAALAYDAAQVARMDPLSGELSLPGWDASYQKEDLRKLFAEYAEVDEEKLWENLAYFLKAVVPAAEEAGVNMAIHPDDPPWPIFGLPRIITCKKNIERMLNIIDSPANGLTVCTGSIGSSPENDIYDIVDTFSKRKRIHFMHMRNIRLQENGFYESGHFSADGSLDMVRILKILMDNGFDGYLRPDHGRMIWGETGRPGYGLYDRALGASYLNGIWETLEKTCKK